jgi:hypothetical protein
VGEHRIEEVSEPDAVRFGNEPEERAVAVEAPRAALLGHLEPRLIMAVKELVCHSPARILVGQLQSFGTKPRDADDGHEPIGQNATDGCVRCEVFELAHAA